MKVTLNHKTIEVVQVVGSDDEKVFC